jgi:molybdenum cofactor biosynthesis enzyme
MRCTFLLVIIAIIFYSCAYDHTEKPVEINTDTCFTQGQRITYVSDIKTILETYCTNDLFGCCHQGNQNGCSIDFTVYSNIAEEARNGKLADRVLGPFKTGPQMPQSNATLTACDTAAIRIWILEDAPEQ